MDPIPNQSILYSVEVPDQPQPKNSTKVRRHPEFVKSLVDSPDSELKTLQLILRKSFKEFANNDCIGTIVNGKAEEGKKPPRQVRFMTYKEVEALTLTLDRAITDLELAPEIEEVEGLKLRFIGVFSKNRPQWLEVDVTTILRGYCLVPIHDVFGVENISYILNHTNLTNLFCSLDSLEILLKCQNLGKIKNIICFDKVPAEIIEQFKENSVTILLYQDILNKYSNSTVEVQEKTLAPTDVVAFCYTSGTTGPPKGAMLSGRNFAAYAGVLKNFPQLSLTEEDVHLSYLPLAHIMENICVLAMLVYGGKIVIYSGDVKNIKEDLQLVKPTFFISVPRLYNNFYDTVQAGFRKTQGQQEIILDKALAEKLKNVQSNGSYTHELFDELVFHKTKQLFGGRCRFLVSGSAPLTPEVHSFMKIIACTPLLEGFGLTESTGGSFVTEPNDPVVGHVGGPTSMCEYKLLDIPQMNYTHNDKDETGRPMPRGEILIGGPGVFLGYYKQVEKTKQTIDEDGFLHTGDVGAILPGTNALKIIDRKKNIFKLKQGQSLAPEIVESVYLKREDLIQEMFLYGDSTQNFCVAIIRPVKAAVSNIAKKKGIEGSTEELYKNKEVRTEFLTDLNNYSKKQGMKEFQQPKNVFLEPTSFKEKNILTTTRKLQRSAARGVYKPEIEAMYKQGMLEDKPE